MPIAPLKPNHRFKAGFTVERNLGGGGFSLVYLMRDKDGMPWAVKECCCDEYVYRNQEDGASLLIRKDKKEAKKIHAHLCKNVREEAKQFANETFRHPHLLPIFGSFEENNTVYLKTYYVEGVTLDVVDDEVQTFDLEWKLKLFEKISAAVKHLHRVGLIHRDIKTQNIMLIKGYESDPNPVVIDTGHARDYTDSSRDLTLIDTPFCAPETNTNGERFGTRGPSSDCFALAGIFYWLMTSQRPPSWTARDMRMVEGGQDPLEKPFAITDAAWEVLRPTLSLRVSDRESDPVELAANLRRAYGFFVKTPEPEPEDKNVKIIKKNEGSGKVNSTNTSDWVLAGLLNIAFFAFAWLILEFSSGFWILWLGLLGVFHVVATAIASRRIGFEPAATTPVKNLWV